MDNDGLRAVKELLMPHGITRFNPDRIEYATSERYLTIGLGRLSTANALNLLEHAGFMANNLPRDLGGAAMYEPRFVVVPSGEMDAVTLEDVNHYHHRSSI